MTNQLHSLLPYNDKLQNRKHSEITTVVVHCTELPDMETARIYGEKIHYASGTGNSGHYYINKLGELFQWVELQRIAHHVANYNAYTIGIELDNLGRYPYWHRTTHQIMHDPYPVIQIDALVTLILKLQKEIPTLQYITGHEDIDDSLIPSENDSEIYVRKKMDPGALFPWPFVMQKINLINIGSLGKKT